MTTHVGAQRNSRPPKETAAGLARSVIADRPPEKQPVRRVESKVYERDEDDHERYEGHDRDGKGEVLLVGPGWPVTQLSGTPARKSRHWGQANRPSFAEPLLRGVPMQLLDGWNGLVVDIEGPDVSVLLHAVAKVKRV
jgi:hypothetical protein